MKIALVNTLYFPTVVGGAERTVQELAETLAGRGHDVTVITLAEGARRDVFVHNGVNVIKVPLWNIYHPYVKKDVPTTKWRKILWHALDCFNVVMMFRLLNELSALRPDIVSTHCLAGFSLLAWQAVLWGEAKLIHVLHDYYLLCARSAHYDKRRGAPCKAICAGCALARAPTIANARNVTAFMGVSHFILNRHNQLLQLGARPKDGVIYNSVPLPSRPPRRRMKARRFGYLGSLIPEKGVLELVKSIGRVGADSLSLDIFGAGDDLYIEKVKSLGISNVRFHGVVDKDDALDQLDVLVIPSLWDEPFGRVVIEAMAAGVPVICASRGGMPEILADSGGGLIFDPLAEPSALDQAILALVNLDEVEMGVMSDAARSRAGQFIKEVQALDYERLFVRTVEV